MKEAESTREGAVRYVCHRAFTVAYSWILIKLVLLEFFSQKTNHSFTSKVAALNPVNIVPMTQKLGDQHYSVLYVLVPISEPPSIYK